MCPRIDSFYTKNFKPRVSMFCFLKFGMPNYNFGYRTGDKKIMGASKTTSYVQA
jgi:hypothetical protein